MSKWYLVPLLFILSACSATFQDVKPWEKGTLAKETMTPAGGNNLSSQFIHHIYFSKEASKGGGSVAGGGCGCN